MLNYLFRYDTYPTYTISRVPGKDLYGGGMLSHIQNHVRADKGWGEKSKPPMPCMLSFATLKG